MFMIMMTMTSMIMMMTIQNLQVSKESDGKLSKDQWLNVFIEAKIHNSS